MKSTSSFINKASLLGKLIDADLNTTADQAIPISSTKYIVEKIIFTNPSIDPDTAVGGIYNAASKGGADIASAANIFSLAAADEFLALTLGTQKVFSDGTLYLSLTTPQGAACTGDIYIFGRRLDI